MNFVEMEGMILLARQSSFTLSEPNMHSQQQQEIRKAIAHSRETGTPFSRWRYERGANHIHASMSAVDRVHIRQEIEIADEFEAALRHAFPERAFAITHIPCYAVSFYQLIDGAPRESTPVEEPLEETAGCQQCESQRAYRLLPKPDLEFPWLTWGVCLVCENDILLTASGEFVRLVNATGNTVI